MHGVSDWAAGMWCFGSVVGPLLVSHKHTWSRASTGCMNSVLKGVGVSIAWCLEWNFQRKADSCCTR